VVDEKIRHWAVCIENNINEAGTPPRWGYLTAGLESLAGLRQSVSKAPPSGLGRVWNYDYFN
jgi:hypothetical protein